MASTATSAPLSSSSTSDVYDLDEATKAHVTAAMKVYPDFPKPGVTFVDIFGLFHHPHLVRATVAAVAIKMKTVAPTIVFGLEARGFMMGPLLAVELGVPFVPVRKAGKLPGKVIAVTYSLEYGSATVEMSAEAVPARPAGTDEHRAIICDDVLATGGTALAAIALCEQITSLGVSKIRPAALSVLVEVTPLGGAAKLPVPVYTLLRT
jgi:adenine phosphoribosyltransferase